MKDIKLSSKIFFGFILGAALCCIVGVIGLINISILSKDTGNMYSKNLVPFQYLQKGMTEVETMRVLLRDHILAEDPVLKRGYEVRFNDAQNRLMSYEKSYGEIGDTDPVILKNVGEFDTYYANYLIITESILNTSNDNDSVMAVQLLHGEEADQAASNMINAMSNVLERKIELAGEEVIEAERRVTVSFITILVVMLIATLGSMSLAPMFVKRLKGNMDHLFAYSTKLKDGDLSYRIDLETMDEFGVLSKELNESTSQLDKVMTSIMDLADLVKDAAQQVSASSMSLAQTTTEQASSVEEITASIVTISGQTKNNSDNANKATDLAFSTKSNAQEGSDEMKDMLMAMNSINDASSKISNIIKVIDDIAFQTNILALNAAVEAARAGQHGKGFAVVAEEVRNLAGRSAKAATETTDMIEGSINEVNKGMNIAKKTSESLRKIVEGITNSAGLISEIANASNEQSSGTSQISIGMDQISQTIQTSSSIAEESASASAELFNQANELSDLIGKFKLSSMARHGRERETRMSRPVRADSYDTDVEQDLMRTLPVFDGGNGLGGAAMQANSFDSVNGFGKY